MAKTTAFLMVDLRWRESALHADATLRAVRSLAMTNLNKKIHTKKRNYSQNFLNQRLKFNEFKAKITIISRKF